MSFSQPMHNLDPRVCPKCGAVQESPGSTFCEQCGAMLSRLEVVPPRPQPGTRRPGRILGSAVSVLIRQPAFIVRRGIEMVLRLVSLIVRGLALVMLLYSLVIAVSLVPQVRGSIPQVKEAALTALGWVQRAGQESVKLQTSLNAPPRPLRAPAASTQKPVPVQSAQVQPLTLRSTPSGAIVVLDTRQAGKTPLTVKVAPGVHKIAVSLPGYATVTRTLTVKSGQPVSLIISLTATR